jgi:hypothetical protein
VGLVDPDRRSGGGTAGEISVGIGGVWLVLSLHGLGRPGALGSNNAIDRNLLSSRNLINGGVIRRMER